MAKDVGVYLAVITAIIAAYLAYRNQLRLKSFDLLYERRVSVLRDVESFLTNLYKVQADLGKSEGDENFRKYLNEYFHEGLMLMHKIKGADFGETADILTDTFWSIIHEPATKGAPISKDEAKDWVLRTMNSLSSVYGFSHRQLTKEIEDMAFSPIARYLNKRKKKSKVAAKKR